MKIDDEILRDKLCKRNKQESITLLCYKRDGLNCHRFILKELVENPELLNAML